MLISRKRVGPKDWQLPPSQEVAESLLKCLILMYSTVCKSDPKFYSETQKSILIVRWRDFDRKFYSLVA